MLDLMNQTCDVSRKSIKQGTLPGVSTGLNCEHVN